MVKRLSIFIFMLAVVSFGFSCASVTCAEREANYINGKRYIPMLKVYIEKDESVHKNLKETYYLALKEWKNLIDSKYKECEEGK